MKLKLRKFEASEHLNNEEVIAEYLTAVLEYADPEVFLSAIGDVAEARGMTAVAGRQYQVLDGKASTRRSHRAPSRATRR
jgi:probable addiction module antidote protein